MAQTVASDVVLELLCPAGAHLKAETTALWEMQNARADRATAVDPGLEAGSSPPTRTVCKMPPLELGFSEVLFSGRAL